MADPTISISPDPAQVNQTAEAEASWSGPPPGSDVTVTVLDLSTDPPTVVKSRTFSSDPYKMSFTPTVVGSHLVDVTWRNGQDEASQGFEVS